MFGDYIIDWQAWATFANAVAILVAALVAGRTFNAWRDQFEYRRKAEHAEKILVVFEEAVATLHSVRDPGSTGPEADAAREVIQQEEPPQRLVIAQIIILRVSDNLAKWQALAEVFAFSRVHFGEDVHGAVRGLYLLVQQVRSAASFYATGRGRDEFQQQMENRMWSLSDNPDEPHENDVISIEIKRHRDTLYEKLNPYIGKQ
jgi:hypothetical protein